MLVVAVSPMLLIDCILLTAALNSCLTALDGGRLVKVAKLVWHLDGNTFYHLYLAPRDSEPLVRVYAPN